MLIKGQLGEIYPYIIRGYPCVIRGMRDQKFAGRVRLYEGAHTVELIWSNEDWLAHGWTVERDVSARYPDPRFQWHLRIGSASASA